MMTTGYTELERKVCDRNGATMMKLKNETKVGNGMTKMHDSSAHLLDTPLI